jgi:hypothetical protein
MPEPMLPRPMNAMFMEFIDAGGEVGDTESWGNSAWSVPRAPYATIDRHVRAMYRSRKTSGLFAVMFRN